MRINKIHNQVLAILRKYPQTRNSDAELHYILLKDFYGTDTTMHTYYAITHRKDLPQIESVGRARRKCQELHPDLRAEANVEAGRMLNEEEFRDYAKATY